MRILSRSFYDLSDFDSQLNPSLQSQGSRIKNGAKYLLKPRGYPLLHQAKVERGAQEETMRMGAKERPIRKGAIMKALCTGSGTDPHEMNRLRRSRDLF